MTTTLTPVDELRDLLERSATDPTSVDHWALRAERVDHLDAGYRLLNETSGRSRLADEQRTLDRSNESVSLIDKIILNVERRANDAAAARAKHPHIFGDTAPGDRFGAEIRNAIDEVREGRAQAFVDYPETRALATSGSGGYGVDTAMGAPVSALAARSVMMTLPGVIRIDATTGDRYRFPRFNAVSVAGTAEGATLNAAATDLDAVDIVYQKFSTYETISTELEEDFSADALAALGARMLKDLGKRVDIGLIQGAGAADVVGLFSQSGVSTTSVAGLPTDFDKVSEAVYQLELNDGTPGAWIMHPRTWRIYKQIKTGISSDKTTLLNPDPQDAPKSLEGLPVYTTSAISIVSGATSVGSTAALVDPSQLVVVTRRAPRLEVSRDVAFSTDQIAIRATTRIGLGVIDPAGGISLLTDIRAS